MLFRAIGIVLLFKGVAEVIAIGETPVAGEIPAGEEITVGAIPPFSDTGEFWNEGGTSKEGEKYSFN